MNIRTALALVFLLCSSLALPACTSAPAPPPESTAEVQFVLEAQREDLLSAKANRDDTTRTWAEEYRAAKVAAITKDFRVLAAKLRTPDEFLKLVGQRDEALAALDVEIARARDKLLGDTTLDTALEANGMALDYVVEQSERDRKLAQLRRLSGFAAASRPARGVPR